MAPKPANASARWALQDAKNRFSEVVDAALRGKPQIVTRRGVETAVILSHAEYERIVGGAAELRPSLGEFLVHGPVVEGEAFGRITLRARRAV